MLSVLVGWWRAVLGAVKAPGSRKALAAAVRALGVVVAGGVLASLPSRLALAERDAQFADSAWELAVVGVFVDVRDALPVLVGCGVLAFCVGRLLRVSAERLPLLVWGAVGAGFSFLLLAWIAAAEFRIERGLFPSYFDFAAGIADHDYVASALPTFWLSRYRVSWLCAAALFGGVVFAATRLEPARRIADFRALAYWVMGAALVTVTALMLHRGSPLLFAAVPDFRVVESPTANFFGSIGEERENVRVGMLGVLRTLQYPPADDSGAKLFGFDPDVRASLAETAARPDCSEHPLRSSLDAVPAGEAADPLVRIFGELSTLLDWKRAPRVWQVSLESFRGDDVHALNSRAAPEITPFVSSLYARDAGADGASAVIAARWAFQGGSRTSQNLAAQTCGLGMMAWGLSLARDFGLLPLRCLPDVLRDAGFEATFYYGANPDFDAMGSFLGYHGFRNVRQQGPRKLDGFTAAWRAPDREVFARALASSARAKPELAQYNLLMSLTNHQPFRLPRDLPPGVSARVAAAVARSPDPIGEDHVRRLTTQSYTDYAFEEFVGGVERSADADRTIVIACADHAVAQRLLWRGAGKLDPADSAVALARVPLVILFPAPLLARARDPERARALVRAANQQLAERVLSENDIPRLVLHLLSASPGLRALPPAWRWHTLGSQTLGGGFELPGEPRAKVLGVNATGHVFWVDAERRVFELPEQARAFRDLDDARRVTPTLLPMAKLMADFSRGYGARCWDTPHVRARR